MKQLNIIKMILKDSNYDLTLFTEDEINVLRKNVFTKTVRGKETLFIKCIVRDKDIQSKPEEIVRQLYAARLINNYGYPKKRLAFEYPVNFGMEKKNADIVIFDKNRSDTSYIIVELKKPKHTKTVKINFVLIAMLQAHRLEYGQTASKSPIITAKTRAILKTSPIFPIQNKVLRTFLVNALL